MLRGWMAEPLDKAIMSDVFILYVHGIGCEPEEKIPELIEFANALNCQIAMFNYRGYAYSDKVTTISEDSI